jgi:RNA polymerase sigma-70 factor, ECF subfamily
MSQWAPTGFESLLESSRRGDTMALGHLLETYRGYLRLLARLQINGRLQGKFDASDVVQETYLRAHRDWATFRGCGEDELLEWLRMILAGRVAKAVRRFFGTQRRDVGLERQLQDDLERSSRALRNLAARGTSPSRTLARHEQGLRLASALDRLPTDYREVIILRQLEELSFPGVAQRMGRSSEAVRKLWIRALSRLRHELGGSSDAYP